MRQKTNLDKKPITVLLKFSKFVGTPASLLRKINHRTHVKLLLLRHEENKENQKRETLFVN